MSLVVMWSGDLPTIHLFRSHIIWGRLRKVSSHGPTMQSTAQLCVCGNYYWMTSWIRVEIYGLDGCPTRGPSFICIGCWLCLILNYISLLILLLSSAPRSRNGWQFCSFRTFIADSIALTWTNHASGIQTGQTFDSSFSIETHILLIVVRCRGKWNRNHFLYIFPTE